MKKIRTGLIGGGMMGNVHAAALRRLGYVDVYAIASHDQETADMRKEQLSLERGYGDYRQLLADDEIDVVHILTPNKYHFPMTKEALEAGKHVLCEKPLSTTLEEGHKLLDIARRTGKCCAVSHNMRYYPLVKQARETVLSGELGKIRFINAAYLQDWLLYEEDYNWRVLASEGGASRAVADIGTHVMDMVQHITELDIVAVFADLTVHHEKRKKTKKPSATFSTQRLKPTDYEEVKIDTEDEGVVMLRFSNGAKGILYVSQVCPGKKNQIRFEIFGTDKSLAWDGEKPNHLWIGGRRGINGEFIKNPELMSPTAARYAGMPGGLGEGYEDTFKNLFGDFYGWIKGGNSMDESKVPFPTFFTGCRELAIVEAVLESNRSGRWTSVATSDSWK